MIKKFLLIDNAIDELVNKNDLYNVDNNFKDLIVLNKVTTELEGIYTNEDIYHGIDKLNVPYTIIDLFDIEEIYY